MKWYSAKQLLKSVNKNYRIEIEERKKKTMTNDSKLKTIIREEMDKVTKMLISSGTGDKVTLTKWLQSLQRINDVCKERNRY